MVTEKSGAGVTTSVIPVEWLVEPLVPVTVKAYVPGGADPDVAMLRLALPDPTTTDGENDAVPTESGRPPRLIATVPVKPFRPVTPIV
ncbi:hypothetical protein [Micromonospora sp. RTP1Z1]|uniref:hypothetical protein n=1 Tax=Micromonospora sp. RTP1Z1 TaxID=2994043 RepID=UPI0029C8A7D6|nr:hypothetical protein [Micromonospora sp. RTP1Z1]